MATDRLALENKLFRNHVIYFSLGGHRDGPWCVHLARSADDKHRGTRHFKDVQIALDAAIKDRCD